VVLNLITNAIKFTPEGGAVAVALGNQGEDAIFRVSDTGTGIDPEFLPFIFDRFTQQENSSVRRFGGLGLGLSIVRHIVELHGGKVRAESAGTGKGATFTVTLPLLRGAQDDAGRSHPRRSVPPPKLKRSGTGPPGVTLTAQYLNSGILPNGSSTGLVSMFAAAS